MPSTSIYRFTSIARPLDPAYPTNRIVILAMPGIALAYLSVTGFRNGLDLAALNGAVAIALAALGGWALVRELAPDDERQAFVGLAGAVLAYAFAPTPSVLLVFALLLLVRMVNRTVGLPARVTDSLSICGLAGWTAYSTGTAAIGIVAALAFALDAALTPRMRRQWAFGGITAAGTIAGLMYGYLLLPRPFWTWSSRSWVLAAVLALFSIRILRTRTVRTRGDATETPLDPRRVQAGMWIAALTVVPTLFGSAAEVGRSLIVWTSLGALALGALTRRRATRIRSAGATAGTLALLAMAQPAAAQDPTAAQIVDRALARFEQQAQAQADLRFESVIESITQFLDGDGEVEKTERETYRQYAVEGVLYEELIAKDGNPLDEDEARDELERREDFAEEIRKRRERGDDIQPEDDNSVRFNQEFIERYQFSILGEETIGDERVWVLYLEPREGDLPVRRRIDHALNKSTGRLWISQRDYGLSRVEFEMRESVRFWGGILGTLRSTVGAIDFDRVADSVWMPKTLDIRFDLRILFSSIRRRITREWGEYLPLQSPG